MNRDMRKCFLQQLLTDGDVKQRQKVIVLVDVVLLAPANAAPLKVGFVAMVMAILTVKTDQRSRKFQTFYREPKK